MSATTGRKNGTRAILLKAIELPYLGSIRFEMCLRAVVFQVMLLLTGELSAQGSLRFHGLGVNAPGQGRVRIPIDDPTNDWPGPPADVGDTDFTIELWMKGLLSDNSAGTITCGANINWIYGNIVLDRDRYNQGRKFGMSLGAGVPVWGVSGNMGDDRTLCAGVNVLDGAWHHLAFQRRRSDGWLWIYVDGVLMAHGDGPDGDLSYPDDGVPGNFCGGPCLNSDPYLVLGAEKHDAGASYPSFNGYLDELRISTTLRYASAFTPASLPFVSDEQTAALYHFNEGSGTDLTDMSGAYGGPSHGTLIVGGNPSGPVWVADSPFSAPATRVDLRMLLSGPYDSVFQLMGDGLRGSGRIPLQEPYTGSGFTPVGIGGGESTTLNRLQITGEEAVVDWVRIELLSPSDTSTVIATRNALVTRFGVVVEPDGSGPGVVMGYGTLTGFLRVGHRNHLRATHALPTMLTNAAPLVDLSDSSTPTFGTDAQRTFGSRTALWSGDTNGDGRVSYVGEGNDRDPILLAIGGSTPTGTTFGYITLDVNMDGTVKYVGEKNDRDPILVVIGGNTPTSIRHAQDP